MIRNIAARTLSNFQLERLKFGNTTNIENKKYFFRNRDQNCEFLGSNPDF